MWRQQLFGLAWESQQSRALLEKAHLLKGKRTWTKKPFSHARELGKGCIGGASGPPPGAEACVRGRCATPKTRTPGPEPACSRGASLFRLSRKQVFINTPTRG